MKFGIIGAMEEEVAQLKDKMTDLTIITKAFSNYYANFIQCYLARFV